MALTLAQLAAELDARLFGDGDTRISALGSLKSAGPGELTFLANPRYRSYLEQTRAGAVLCTPDQAANCPLQAVAVNNPHLAFARISRHFDPPPYPSPKIQSTASVAPST